MDFAAGNQDEQNIALPWRPPPCPGKIRGSNKHRQQCPVMMGLRDRDLQGKRSPRGMVRSLGTVQTEPAGCENTEGVSQRPGPARGCGARRKQR